MGEMTRRLQACMLALVFLWGCAHAVQFEVSSRTTKCIAEEIQTNVVVVGDYKIVHSDETHKITVKVLKCSASFLILCCWLAPVSILIHQHEYSSPLRKKSSKRKKNYSKRGPRCAEIEVFSLTWVTWLKFKGELLLLEKVYALLHVCTRQSSICQVSECWLP